MKTKLEQLLSEATARPWRVDPSFGDMGNMPGLVRNYNPHVGTYTPVDFRHKPNARLIAHAVNVLPELVEALQVCIHAVDMALCGTPSAQYFNDLKQRLGSKGYTLEDNLKLNMADIKGACTKAHKAARAALAAAEKVSE